LHHIQAPHLAVPVNTMGYRPQPATLPDASVPPTQFPYPTGTAHDCPSFRRSWEEWPESRLAAANTLLLSLVHPSQRTLEQWKQGRRIPGGAAKTVIRVAELHPEILRQSRPETPSSRIRPALSGTSPL